MMDCNPHHGKTPAQDTLQTLSPQYHLSRDLPLSARDRVLIVLIGV